MPITQTQLEAAAQALRQVLAFERPADAVLHDFFAARRGLGAHDRGFVAETVYGVLRRRRTVERLAPGGTPRELVLAYLVGPAGVSVRELAPVLRETEGGWLARVKAAPLDTVDAAARAELPEWIAQRLAAVTRAGGLHEAARALNEPAPLDLRVNTLRATREDALAQLAAGGFEVSPTPWSPVGIRCRGRPALSRHPLFADGTLEVQDEGSQLIGYLVAPRRGDLVVDFCAGAGGKSLMLGALMRSHGRIYALDTSRARLMRLKPRLARSGLSNVHPHLITGENDVRVKRLAGKADRVLVDAPCSGLGTLRRNPDLKWRQSPQALVELAARQSAILRAAAGLTRPGGRLVYATCSLLPEENDAVVAGLLRELPAYAIVNCGAVLRQQGIDLDTGEFLRLWPHRHGTDGFFAAILEKTAHAGAAPGAGTAPSPRILTSDSPTQSQT
ncbi:MAG: RsmB/NOP family class I SAM-dependent RNA methyltransferase [Burkholderiales bacterium]|nr:RsmB/NOP family class I SAM-dependent RNA methyltransferase [Burkholderiales bacterium]